MLSSPRLQVRLGRRLLRSTQVQTLQHCGSSAVLICHPIFERNAVQICAVRHFSIAPNTDDNNNNNHNRNSNSNSKYPHNNYDNNNNDTNRPTQHAQDIFNSSIESNVNAESENDTDDNVQVNLQTLKDDLYKASQWNQSKGPNEPKYLRRHDKPNWDIEYCRDTAYRYNCVMKILHKAHKEGKDITQMKEESFLRNKLVRLAFRVLLKCNYNPDFLSKQVRDWEVKLGQFQATPLSHSLSLILLEANAKAGNLGRVFSLLQWRLENKSPLFRREIYWATNSIQAANFPQIRYRLYWMPENQLKPIDDPTRWLDAILIHMHQRGVPLTQLTIRHMLECYVGGKSGKMLHHFWRVSRKGIYSLPSDERPQNTKDMPTGYMRNLLDDDELEEEEEVDNGNTIRPNKMQFQPIKVQIKYNGGPPPFYKVPSQAKGKYFTSYTDKEKSLLRIDRETEPDYSPVLSAAFAFADSLQHGACGHEPIKLDTYCYNVLIKTCVRRGALWRAMKLIDETMNEAECPPNAFSYTILLQGFSSVGDIPSSQEYFQKMINAGLKPNAFTVRTIVQGLLNVGDASGAVTVVQDMFNQYSVLPPYTTHTRIIEFCLGADLTHEAKRHVYFLQQLWYWEPNEHHPDYVVNLVSATQRNTQLQKPALQKLFAYFGEKLDDADFL